MVFDNRKYSALCPAGEQVDNRPLFAPRLSDLRGKTICQVSNGLFHADDVFSAVTELAEKHFPGVKIIPWTEFPVVSPTGDMDQICEDLREALKERKCDAVISSTGG